MSRQPSRMAEGVKGLAGSAIDRSRPLTMRINGRLIHGYRGDTVLSAALASGIEAAGTFAGEPLALDEGFAPAVVVADAERDQRVGLPMDRMPAIDGLDLLTVGARRPSVSHRSIFEAARYLIWGPYRTLRHRFEGIGGLEGPWFSQPPAATVETGTLVIGGGVAGLEAAVAAGEAGEQVVLVEREPELGGDAAYWGRAEGEEPFERFMARTAEALRALPNVTIVTRALAFAIRGSEVCVHELDMAGQIPGARVVAYRAGRIVIATGAKERLPVFPGNRSPGVTPSLAAYRRAERYGVWQGQKTIFSTAGNLPYRLAVLAADAGIEVRRVNDVRPEPQSRYIDFAKASGIPLTYGVSPRAVRPTGQGLSGLYVRFAVTAGDQDRLAEPMWTDQLIVSGGWQPDLSLWLMAGGRCEWLAGRLVAVGDVPGLALAGAAAGYFGTPACVASGRAATDRLLGRQVSRIEDVRLDPIYESYDAPAPVTGRRNGARGTAFLDSGVSLANLPGIRRLGRVRDALGMPDVEAQVTEQPRRLSVADIAAAVQLGLARPEDAGEIAAERCIAPLQPVVQPGSPAASVSQASSPHWLAGRFGKDARILGVVAESQRGFEAGALLYRTTEPATPLDAVGVMLVDSLPGAPGGTALVASAHSEGDPLVLRDTGGMVRVKLVGRDAVAAAPARPVPAAPPSPPAQVEMAAPANALDASSPLPPASDERERSPAPETLSSGEATAPETTTEPAQPNVPPEPTPEDVASKPAPDVAEEVSDGAAEQLPEPAPASAPPAEPASASPDQSPQIVRVRFAQPFVVSPVVFFSVPTLRPANAATDAVQTADASA